MKFQRTSNFRVKFPNWKKSARVLWVANLTAASLSLWSVSASAGDSSVPGLPSGIPAAALHAEPALPALTGWPFGEAFPRTSGTGRLSNGAFFWTDYLVDDLGAGTYSYPFGPEGATGRNPIHGQNGADIFRAAVGIKEGFAYFRVDWNTLLTASVPIAEWAFDTDNSTATGVSALPVQAGATAPGTDLVLVMSSTGAYLINPTTNAMVDVASVGGSSSVDMASRSFIARIPTGAIGISGQWRARLVAGLADATGQAFAPAWSRTGTAAPVITNGTRIYNETFRTVAQEPASSSAGGSARTWNNAGQSTALAAADASSFSAMLDWSALSAATTTPEDVPAGYSQRWFVSSIELGQGLLAITRTGSGSGLAPTQFFGRVQPYTVYLPTDFDPAQTYPLTIILHAGDSTHNGFLGTNRNRVYFPMCEQRKAICITPLGRGVGSWYINDSEADVWEAWHAAATSFKLNPDRTIIGGWSMGGTGATHFIVNHPDLFADGFVAAGAGYYDTLGRRDQADDPLRAENILNLPVMWLTGTTDVARPATLNWETFLHSSGVRYRTQVTTSVPNGHGDVGTGVGWDEMPPYFGQFSPTRILNPGRVVFRWIPSEGRADLGTRNESIYWLSGIAARDPAARWSRLDVVSGANPEPDHFATYTDMTGPLLSTTGRVITQAWTFGPTPAPSQTLTMNLTNLGSIAADVARTNLSTAAPISVDVTTDGPTNITLSNVAAATAAIGGTTLAVSTGTVIAFNVASGRSNVMIVGGPLANLLAAARGALDRGSKISACAQILGFEKMARARSGKELPPDQAAALIDNARRLMVTAGC